VVSGTPLVPALYAAEVGHSRRSPLRHKFRYRAGYWLVDFDHLPPRRGVARWFAQIRHEDHMDIRRILEERGMVATRILLLTGVRSFGYVFDPISVFWCYEHGATPTAIVAEVHNTYGDRHAYVLDDHASGEGRVAKAMYVSPFNSTPGTYHIRVSEPGTTIEVSVTLERPDEAPFVATLRARRQPFTTLAVARTAFCYSSWRTRFLIQWQGLRLWRRGLVVQPR
jgi:uncharacterized protein